MRAMSGLTDEVLAELICSEEFRPVLEFYAVGRIATRH
jgi:hypothetical protein